METEGVDGAGVEATKRSGRPFTIRSVKRFLILLSSSVSSVFAMDDLLALSCTLRNEFAIFCNDFFKTTLLYTSWKMSQYLLISFLVLLLLVQVQLLLILQIQGTMVDDNQQKELNLDLA